MADTKLSALTVAAPALADEFYYLKDPTGSPLDRAGNFQALMDLFEANMSFVTKVSTPVDNQVGVWTGDGTLEGDANLVWTGNQLQVEYDVSGESFPVRLRNGAAHSATNRVGMRMEMLNSTAGFVEYGRVEARSEDTTAGAENGAVQIDVMRNGTVEEAAVFNTNDIVMNENGADRDFRVESSNDAQALFVDGANGRLGFGTSAPQSRAEFLGLGAADPSSEWFASVTGISFLDDQEQPAFLCAHASETADDQPILFFRRARGTLDAPTAIADVDDAGSLLFSGYDGTIFQNVAEVKAEVDGAVSGGTVPMALSFLTGTATGSRTERMRISSAGVVTAGGSVVQVQPSEGGFVDGDKDALDSALQPAAIGSTVQGYDVDILKADTADTLTAGYDSSDHDAGTKASGTFTPDPADSNFQYAVNGGAHTLAPPASSCCIVIHYTNNASAGAITTSGFTAVSGDSFTTTDTEEFLCTVVRANGKSVLTVKALQ